MLRFTSCADVATGRFRFEDTSPTSEPRSLHIPATFPLRGDHRMLLQERFLAGCPAGNVRPHVLALLLTDVTGRWDVRAAFATLIVARLEHVWLCEMPQVGVHVPTRIFDQSATATVLFHFDLPF